jgi:hypothetical protein
LNKTKVLNFHKLLEGVKLSNDNLHRIAISNIVHGERTLERWWQKKYKTSIKHFDDCTREELIIEMLEDFYDNNRTEIDRFYDSLEREKLASFKEWDGKTDDEYEIEIQKRLSKFKKIDLSAFQSDKDRELTEEEEASIFNSLGRNLPKSTKKEEKSLLTLGSDEFDEEFGV